MALEIEFEDGDADDAEPAESERVGHAPARRWWNPYAAKVLPTPGPRALLAVAAVAVAAAAAAGFDFGRTAQQARASAALNLAPSNAYIIDALPSDAPPSSPLPDRSSVERTILLRVLNDGPRPVTVLGGTLYSPDIAVARLVPEAGGVVRPGGVSTLRTVAEVSCGGGPHEGADATFAEVSFATVADIELRTADGQVRRVRIIVEQYSTRGALGSCATPGRQVLARNR